MKKLLRLFCSTCFFLFGYHLVSGQIISPVSDTTICVGESVTLQAALGSYMYNWSTGDLSNSITVSPSTTTSYSLRVFIPDTGTELISNGDFDSGNTGFYSEYVYCPDPILSSSNHSHSQSLWEEGRYAVDNNPNEYHANFSACGGHTGNNPDNYLIVNGAPDENVVVWSQTITVNPNQYYAFSTWACNVHPTNPARLEFMIDGVLMGDYIEPSSGSTCNWEEFYSLWYSGSKTSIEISIVNKNLIRSGNDYALDGISFNPLLEVPDLRTVNVANPATVNAGSDQTLCGNLQANLSASITNQSGFFWTSSGDGTFSNSNDQNATYLPGSNDIVSGSVVITANAVSNTPCGSISDDLILTLNPVPEIGFGDHQASCGGGDVSLDAGNPGSAYLWNTGETSQTITVSTDGDYWVEVTNSFGCVESDTVHVGFYADLTIDLGPDRTVCTGEPVVLNAGISGATYSWSTGETTQEIIVYSAGNYSVTVTNSYGCNASDNVNVNLVPPPTVDLGPDQVINDGDVITLDAGNHFLYIWDDGSRGRYLNVDKAGLYAVRVMDMNGCSAMDMVNITSSSGTIPPVTLNDTIICKDESVELYAGSDFLFNWDVDGLSSRVVVTPDTTTTYNLRVFYVDKTLELVNNGDFSLGNIGFQSDYYYCTRTWWWSCRSRRSKYIIDNDTDTFGSDKSNCGGVTGNSPDNVLVVEGGNVNSTVWEQDINVDTDSYYTFSLNVTNLKNSSTDDFELVINGQLAMQFSTANPCDWTEYKTLVYSGTDSQFNIKINNTATSGSNNAFAFDGISMFKLAEIPLDVTVTVIQHAIANAGLDLSICESGAASVNGTIENASSFLWTSLGDGTFDNANNLNANYTPGLTDIANGFVDLELSAQPIAPCTAPDRDTLRVDINSNLLIDLGADREFCQGDSVILTSNFASGTYLWNTGETTQSITVKTAGNYSVIVSDINGCTGTDDVNVTVHPNPIIDLGSDQVTCDGLAVMLDAGHPGSSYIWSNGETLQAILTPIAGNYSVVVTDANGCMGMDDANIIVNLPPTVDLGMDQETCAGGSITLDAGNTGSTYLWSNGSTSQSITVSTSGNYSVVVTDANGCSATDDVNVTVHPNPTVDLGMDQETCAGGSITLDAGNTGSTYLWNTGASTQSITVSASGNYSVVVTDVNGCSATDDVNVTVHPNPTVDLGMDQETCAGGSITLDAGNTGSTYLWSNGSTSQSITVSTSGNYSVVVTDANGCSATDDVNVTVHPNPTVDLGMDQETCAGGSITLDAGNTGSTYLWNTGASTQSIAVSTSGNYSVFVTDANGCSATDDVNVTVHPNPTVDLGMDQQTCAGGSITLDAGNTGSTYLWNTGASTQSITVSTSGNYSVVVTDVNGCSATDDVNVTVHPNPTVDLGMDQQTCAGGSITLDAGNTGSTYLWSNGSTSQSITVSTSGNYSVVVTDANGCSATDDVNVTVHSNPTVDLGMDQQTCAGGSITLDAGNTGSTYLWNTGASTQSIAVSTSGNYSVVVTDVNGCSATDDVNVTVHPNPTVDLGMDQETCAGGSITLDAVNTGSTYLWNTGASTQSIAVSTSGNYSVVVTDANGCSATDDVNVTVHPNPTVDLGMDQETCAGGSITLDAGNTGSTYLWSNGSTSQSITVSTSGNYSVVVTDANGCSATDDVNVTVHPNPTVDLGMDQQTCAGGSITLDAGNTGSTYLWNTGASTQSITVSASGNYSVVVTDANGCSATDDVNVTVHPNPTVDLGMDQETCAGGSITLDAGNTGSTYLWNTGASTQSITVSASGNYSVVVTDANGCSATDDVNVTVHPNPTVDLGMDQQTCAGGSITLDAGNTGSTYLWNTGASTQSIAVSTSGNYSVVVTDANGCSATDDVNVTVHPNPTVDLGMDQQTCAGGSITLDAGNTGSTYLWNTGASTQSIAVSTSGNYSVVVTDVNGCSATDDVNVTVHPNPTVDLGMDQETCAGGSITLDAVNTGSTYLWNTGASTQSIAVSTSGNYSVVVTDANGCSATDDVNVTVHPNPTVDLGMDQETCAGGSITLDAGNTGSTYLWSNGSTSQSITVSTSGNYSVVVTDANGCSATDDVNVTVHPNPTVDLGMDQQTCAGGSITLDAGNTGSTYLWNTGASTQSITVSASGNYSVVVTDVNGCSATDDVNVTVHPNPTVDLGMDQETCAGGSITLDAGNTGSTYLWNTGASTQSITVSASGNYSVFVTDANGCSATDDVNVTVHPNPTVDLGMDQQTCAGGSITLDAGNTGSTYLWNTGASTQSITVSASGNYSVVVTDANGCSATDDVNVTVHPNPTVDLGMDQQTCAGGSITLDAGNTGSTYLWNTGASTQSITVSASGNYSVFVTDANGCSATDDVNVTVHPNPTVDLGMDQETCAGGSITLDAGNTGSTYLWNTGASTQSIAVSTSGNYSVVVTDANGCSATDDVNVTVHPNPTVDLGMDQETCAGGSITLDAGNTGSTYLWSNGSTSQSITVSTSGNYSVFVTDANGCSATDDVNVTVHPNPTVDLGMDQETCAGGSITLDAGNTGSTYLWNTGASTQSIAVSTSGNYSVVVTDANGCSATDDVNVTVHPNPTVDLGMDQETCAGGSITLDAGNTGSTYLWNTGASTQSITVSASGNYSVVVTDANGCSATDDVNVTVHPNPTVDLGMDQETCAGGSITLDAGNTGSTYLWNTGASTQSITVSASGNYSVFVTDANGCSATDDVNVTVHPNPTVDLGMDQQTCAGGSITLDAGNTGSTYLWNTGASTQSIAVSTSGNYSVVVTDANGCSATDDVNVTVHPNPTVDLGMDQETCAGGSITLDAGNTGSTYLWNTGASTQSITVSASGNYSVVVTDANGCSATDDVNVTVHPNPTVDLGMDQETCAGGSITLDAGNTGSTYLWNTGASTQSIAVSTSGNYSVVVTDANGCSATDDVNVTVHPNPTVDLGMDQETCAGGSITLDAGNTGSTYLWSNGSTSQSITVSTSGNYSVFVTDANGCSATDDVNVTVHPNPTVDLGMDQETCAGGSITLDAGNTGSTYLWNTGASTQSIAVSTSGNYSVVVTDANGCSATDDVNVTVHPNPTVDLGMDQETCAGGSITLDAGNTGSTYLWNTGASTQSITVSTSGNYSVVVTDANGCSATDDVNVTVHPNPTVDLGMDQQTCAGGSITLDAGNTGSTYLWNTGASTQSIAVSTSGNYSVVVTDANGCSATDDVNVTVHPNPTVDLGMDQETCAGGSITLDAGNTGSTYLWNTGASTQSITVSASGNYSVFVTDANGCSATDDVNVTVHPNPTVDLGMDQETCAGGSITLDAGNTGSTYLWNTGASTQSIAVSTSGNYSVVVTDANGCSATDDVNVTVHPNPTVDLGMDQETCAGGSITLDAGNTGSTYLWNTGASTQSITVSASGNYSVVVTDANGCSATDDVNVTVHPNPTVDLGMDQETCAGGSITLDAGNTGSTYLWNTGASTQSIAVSTSGNYSVVVTDANGCSATDDVNVTVHPNPTVDLGMDQETCAGGSITLDAGNTGSTYLWSNGSTSQSITVSTSGNYSVFVTDANGCSATDDVNVTVHPNPTVDLGMDQETCAGGSITLDAGNTGSTYLWNTGASTQSIAVSTSGNYSVVVTDANGCSATDDVNVTVHPNPTVDLGMDQETCAGGSITLDAGNTGSTYLWNTGASTQSITVSTSGNYSVVVTDANGCSATDDVNVTVHPNPTVDLGMDQQTCAGGSITLDAGNTGSTYLWNTGASTQSIAVSTSGNYSVVVTDANGCSATDDVNVTVHPNPTVDLGMDQETCAGGSITLDAGNTGSTYLWNTGASTQSITVSASGNYSVVVTDANGCSATDDVNINILQEFDFDLIYSTNLVCHGDSTYIEAPNMQGYSYRWKKDGVDIIGENLYSITIGESGLYSLEILNNKGCIAKDQVEVEVISLPNSPLPDRVDICYGESVKLDIGEGEKFFWNDGLTTQSRLVTEAGIYHVRVQDINGCVGHDSVEVIVHDLPIVDLGPDLYICEGEELILEAPDGYYTEWIPGGIRQSIYVYEKGDFTLRTTDEFGCTGEDDISIFIHENPDVYLGRDTVIAEGSSIILDAGSGYVEYEWSNQEDSQFLKVEKDGEYSVNVVDVNGCKGNGKVKVAVNPRPTINLGASAGICEGTSLMLDAGNWEKYLWNTGDTTRTIVVNNSGDFTVQVWDMFGIMGTDTISVEVYPSPKIQMSVDTLSMYKGQSLTIDAGAGYSSYHWNTGSDWRSIEVDEVGEYSVKVENEYGCVAQASITVKLLEPKMVVPNVFTPNGKGPNEIFYPVFKGIVNDFEMYIYTRWGEQVFKLEKDMVANNELKHEGWNGTYKGKDAEIGVYVWIIFYGGKERAHGTVTLFR